MNRQKILAEAERLERAARDETDGDSIEQCAERAALLRRAADLSPSERRVFMEINDLV